MTFWKADGELYFVLREDLLAAIQSSERTHVDIKGRMGAGFHYLEDLLAGKRIDGFSAQLVEWGIISEAALPKDKNPPFPYSSSRP
jgi:hypothetical protein